MWWFMIIKAALPFIKIFLQSLAQLFDLNKIVIIINDIEIKRNRKNRWRVAVAPHATYSIDEALIAVFQLFFNDTPRVMGWDGLS